MSSRKMLQRWTVVIAILSFVFAITPAFAQATEIAYLPTDFTRLSWGAVIAGAIIALMVQLALNLLGVGVGITTITSDPHDRDDHATPIGTAAKTTVVWMIISTLISLFVGGWLAARFAGIPNDTDGVLHGLMVWGIVVIVTLFLVTTTIGRLFSSVSNMIGQAMSLLSRATGAAAHTAANVAGAAANVAGSAVKGAASAVGSAGSTVAHAAKDVAEKAQPVVEQVREQIDQRVQAELDKHPELRQALKNQTTMRQKVEDEVRTLLTQAGLNPARLEAEAEVAVDQVRDAAQTAVDTAKDDPRGAIEQVLTVLGSVVERGSYVLSDIDRQSVIDVVKSRTGQTQEEAMQTVRDWENRLQQTGGEVNRIRQQAESQIRQLQHEAESRINQVRSDIEDKVEDVREAVDMKARETAAAVTKAISSLALAAFAAILIGAIAAGLGGMLGAPDPVLFIP